eukprot:GHVR01031733.1.p1 GENE.GHVR01031733.1~~GHVR01031733.1.p1  ORF type:complete len:714 (+),score=95.88 GHVR01031733.1:463-2604(+)
MDNAVNEKELLEQQIVQYQREIQRVNDAASEKERNVVRLTRENLTLELNSSKAEREVLVLRKSVKQLEESQKEVSKVAVTPPETKLMATISELSGELEKASGELEKERAKNSSQQDVFSRKIEDMSKKKDEDISEYYTQVRTLHAELLKREGYCSPENLPYQGNFAKKVADPNPKREVSVASTARSVSPGTTQVILSALQRMEERVSGLASRIDQSDARAPSVRPKGETARGRSITRRDPGDPDDDDDDSDDSEHSSDDDDFQGEPPGGDEDPTGEEDRNPIGIRINPLRAESRGRVVSETRKFKEHETVKVPKFPTLPSLPAWKLQVGKNLVAAGGRIDQREIAWWAEVSKETSTFDSLADSGEDRFVSLDLKLSISLSVMLKEVNNEVTASTAQKEQAASQQNKMLKGRQIAWLLFTFFKRNPKMRVFYSVTDLAKLDWMGDKNIHRFLMTWRLLISQMQTTLPADELIEILLQKVEKSIVLAQDIAHFYRKEEDDPDRNSDFLIRSMENYLDRARYRTNRANDLHSLLSPSQAKAGAPSVVNNPGGISEEAKERKKKKRQEKKGELAAAGDAAAPAPTPKGGKGKGKSKDPKEKRVCYYRNQPGGCPKTAEECWFLHKKLPAAEVAEMIQPISRAASRANSPAGGGATPKAKAGAKAKAAGGRNLSYCFKFAQPGGCNDNNCSYMHMGEAMIKEFERAGKALRRNTNAKP